MVCDEKGHPCVLLLTPGNVHDCKVAQLCIEATPPSAELVADKGYDSQALCEWLDERGTEAVIRRSRTAKSSTITIARSANSAMSSSGCSAASRTGRIATRFDRNIKNFAGAISLAAAVIWWL